MRRWLFITFVVIVPAAALAFVVAILSAKELSRQGDPPIKGMTGVAAVAVVDDPALPYHPVRNLKVRLPQGISDVGEQRHPPDQGRHAKPVESGAGSAAKRSSGQKEEQKADGYEPYCGNPEDQGRSGLCASWAAVSEYEVTNSIARSSLRLQAIAMGVSLILGLLGIVGLIAAARAADAAAAANRIAGVASAGYLVPLVLDAPGGRLRAGVENVGGGRAELRRFRCEGRGENPGTSRTIGTRTCGDQRRIIGADHRLAIADLPRSAFVLMEVEMLDAVGRRRRITSSYRGDGDDWVCLRQIEHDDGLLRRLAEYWMGRRTKARSSEAAADEIVARRRDDPERSPDAVERADVA